MPSPLLAVRVQPRDLWVALASFCLVGAVLLHVLAAPVIARTWPVETESTTMVATDGAALVPVTGREISGVTLRRTSTERQLAAGFVPAGTTAYEVSVDTRGPSDVVVERERRIVTQLDGEGTAVITPVNRALVYRFNASGDAVQQNVPLDGLSGQVLRFPRDTPAADRMLWDPATGRAWLASYEGAAEVDGHRTLIFRQRVDTATVSDADGGAGSTTVTLDRQIWVRPEIGAIVDERLDIQRTRRVGTRDAILLDADFRTRDADVASASAQVDDVLLQSRWLLVVGPVVLLLLGLLALAAAVITTMRHRTSGSSITRSEEQR